MRTPNPAIAETFCCVLPASASMQSSKTSFVLPCRQSVCHFPYSLISLFLFIFIFIFSFPLPLFPFLFSLPFSLSLLIFFSIGLWLQKSQTFTCDMSICNDLSNEKCCVILSKHFQSTFQLSNVAVRKNCSSLTNCPRVLLLSFRFQFDSKNLFQSKSSLFSWTSLRVAHNVGACDGRGLGGLSNAAKRNAKADQL